MLYTLSITEDNKIINILVFPTVISAVYRLVKERSAFSHRVCGGGQLFLCSFAAIVLYRFFALLYRYK